MLVKFNHQKSLMGIIFPSIDSIIKVGFAVWLICIRFTLNIE